MDRTITLTPIRIGDTDLEDPRGTLGDNALALASRNAFPVVATRVARQDKGGLLAGAAIAVLLGAVTFWSMSGSRDQPASAPVRQAALPAPPSAASPTPGADPAAPASLPAALAPTAPAPFAAAPAGMPAIDHAHSPLVVYDTGGSVALPGTPTGTPAAKGTLQPPLGDNEAFATRVGGAEVETASATRMTDPANTVSQGTLISAVLETAIDSDLPGYVRALVSRDVRSFDGAHVLIPRSSRLIGQYKSGLAAGQTRAYVLWTRLIRPDGVSIALASPGVDHAGRSGLSGTVDGHFMKRFGSAMLLSVVGGLGALGGGGTAVVLSNGGTSAATVAAQRDAQIPPTIRVRQGEPIRIFTARDLDFSTVAAGA